MPPLPQPPTVSLHPDSDMPPLTVDDSILRKRATQEKAGFAPTRSQPEERSTVHSAPSSSGNVVKIVIGVLSLGLSAALIYDKLSTGPDHDHAVLSGSYALCSREGAHQIYTVDPKKPLSECLLVQGPKFSATGSFGTSLSQVLIIHSLSPAFWHLPRPLWACMSKPCLRDRGPFTAAENPSSVPE
ncbi:hypothetical protein C8Q80DRAFT_155937 [Daedaleopsis nitida]|nr:hypothetical protein C8Q80DRAFT_155937 [Daedaleopsis nitida]